MYILASLLFFFWHTSVSDYDITRGNKDTENSSNQSVTHSALVSYLGKPISVFAIIHRELGLIPWTFLLLMIFYCNVQNKEGELVSIVSKCQDEIHMLCMGFSALVLVLSMILALASTIFYNDTQPDSNLPWANCSSGVVLLKFLKKIVIVVCLILSYKSSGMDLIMLILVNIINCFIISRLARHLYMNDIHVHGTIICCEGGITWISAVSLIQKVFKIGYVHDFYVLLSIPVAFFLLKSLLDRRNYDLIYTSKVEYLPNQSSMEQYVSIMCRVFHGQSRCENYIILQGVFASHIRTCSAPGCPCEDISRALDPAGGDENLSASTSVMKSVRAISIKQTIQRNLSIHSADIPLTDYNSINKKKFFEFMRSLLERALTTVTKNTRLYIQLAYIHFLFLENKFIALYDLMNAQDSKPTLFEEFLIYRLKYFWHIK